MTDGPVADKHASAGRAVIPPFDPVPSGSERAYGSAG